MGAQRRSTCESHTLECHFVDFEQGEWWQLPLSDAVTQVWPLMQLQPAPLTAAQGLFDQSSHVCMYIEHCYDCKCVCRVPCHALRRIRTESQLTFSHAHQGARINYKARPGEL